MIVAVTQTEVLHWLGWGGLGLLALVLLFSFGALLALVGLGAQWARRQFVAADRALVPVGQSPVGKLLYDAVVRLRPQVDEVSDPYVQTVHGVVQGLVVGLVQTVAPQYIERAQKAISPESVQRFLAYILTGAEELLDGQPADMDDVPTASYGVPEPDASVMPAPEQEHMPGGKRDAAH